MESCIVAYAFYRITPQVNLISFRPRLTVTKLAQITVNTYHELMLLPLNSCFSRWTWVNQFPSDPPPLLF